MEGSTAVPAAAEKKVRVSFHVDPHIRKAIDGVCAIRNTTVAKLLEEMSLDQVVHEYHRLRGVLR